MRTAGLVVVCLLMLIPFLLMVSGSLQSIVGSRIGGAMKIIPSWINPINYKDIFVLPGLWRMFINSGLMVAGYIVPAIIVNGLAAYAFVFYQFKWKKLAFMAAMATVFIPGSVIIIPRYMAMKVLGLAGIPAVLIMTAFWAPGLFMFREYFRSIPMSLVESARIDGARDWQIFLKIILPLSKPIIGAAIVFQGIGALSEYLWQMLNLQAPEQQTLIVGLYASIYLRLSRIQTSMGALQDFGYSLAVAVVIMLPMVIMFLLSSRYFIGELTMGGTKE